MIYTATKIFKFEMAHQLSCSYSTECQRIHGHSYKVEVTVSSKELNADGMVVDFKRLKEIVEPFIGVLDHNCVTEKEIGYNPTAENMAFHMIKDFNKKFRVMESAVRVIRIRLWETDTCYVTVESEYIPNKFKNL